MAMFFEVKSYSIRGGSNGAVDFQVCVWYEKLDAEQNVIRVAVPQGNRTVTVPAEAMAAIEAMDKTNNQKVLEVKAIIQANVEQWGIAQAEEAKQWFDTVCPDLPLSFPL